MDNCRYLGISVESTLLFRRLFFLIKHVDRKRKQCYIFRVFNRYPPVAQLVEQLPFKEMVAGSIPAGRTNRKSPEKGLFLFVASSETPARLAGRNRTEGAHFK